MTCLPMSGRTCHGAGYSTSASEVSRPYFGEGFPYFRNCSRLYDAVSSNCLNTPGCVCPTGGIPASQLTPCVDKISAVAAALSTSRLRKA